MVVITNQKENIFDKGFSVFENIYTEDEIENIIKTINKADQSNNTFRKTAGLFAMRQFLNEVPDAKPLIFNQKLKTLIDDLFGPGHFVVKSIYFDKPQKSNWFVAWHQDQSISVNKKTDTAGYSSWTVRQGQIAVQPPLEILENNFTIRIHLDKTDEQNGALKVVPGSHLKGVQRAENIDWSVDPAVTCNVNAGGIMMMRPLLMHASDRTTSNQTRRVVHIEFSNVELPEGLNWSEKENY